MHRHFTILTFMVVAGMPLAVNAESTEAQYNDAHAKAIAAQEQAGEADNQWTTTGNVLVASEKAADSADYDHATELAERAQTLAQLAFEQAQDNDENWRHALPE